MENEEQSWKKLTPESARFVLDQAEKRLQATIDNMKSLTEQAVHVMQFSIPLSVVVVGLIFTEQRRDLLWIYLVVLAFLIMISYLALHLYETNAGEVRGYSPGELMCDARPALSDGQQCFELMIHAIRRIEIMIEEQEARNLASRVLFSLVMAVVKLLVLGTGVLFAMAAWIP